MRSGTEELTFKRVTDVDRAILPIFGAHPLSNIFNEAPPLLVEGEDDERIWQQAVRSSRGAIRIYPCPVDTVDALFEYERETRAIIDAIYDNAIAYSLRDRDATPEYIDDFGPVIRMRLSCRAAENLMLSDDVLAQFGIDWDTMKRKIEDWAASNQLHQYNQAIQAFLNEGALRKTHDLKEIRNILIGLLSNKPWEVIVGQAIAKLRDNPTPTTPNSIRDYLGEKVCEKILRLKIQ
jgi:hypothetical protein